METSSPESEHHSDSVVDESAGASADQVSQADKVDSPSPKRKKISKKTLLIITAVVLMLAGAAAYFLFMKNDSKSDSSKTETATTKDQTEVATETVSAELQAQIDKFTAPTTGEKWLETPKAIALQGYFTVASYTEDADTTRYYEVGSRGGSTIILGIVTDIGESLYLFEKAADGKVKVIVHPDANATYQEGSYENYFRSDITIDKSQRYDSLSIPAQLSIGNGEYVTNTQYPSLGRLDIENEPEESVKTSLVKKYGSSSLYRIERTYLDTKLTAIGYQMRTPFKSEMSLAYNPILTDQAGAKWDNGVSTAIVGGIVRGCGAGESISRGDAVTDADFVKAGKTASGQQLYEFKSSDATLVQKALQETKEYYDGSDEAKANMSITDFVKQHGIFAYKSTNAGWLIYTTDDLAPVGGCAKPVIYLYPSLPQNVTVKVGADVKISDPLYSAVHGWEVFAWPNGQLNVNGQQYTSLFWEGPGRGEYPAITSGTIVSRGEAAKTIRTQLKQQGLNSTEAQDFMDYWESRIPESSYVRLSWFNTRQLDELAPLSISPKPKTVIRVFLDMAGLDKPIAMPTQEFSAPLRTGFTVVEWGGLSRTKLY